MATECPVLATPLQQLLFLNSTCAQTVKLESMSRAINDTVIFSCEASCENVYARNFSVCQPDGTWTLTFPFCKGKTQEVPVTSAAKVVSTSGPSGDGLSQNDVITISATVGGVAALVFVVILILLLYQKFYRKDPNPDERKQIINPYGSGRESFLSRDFRTQQSYLYDNNFDAIEFKERPLVGPRRSMSFQDQREMVESPYPQNGYYDTHLQRTNSLDFNRTRHYDNNFPVERMSNFQTSTLPHEHKYRVPRPTVGPRFEPLWNSNIQHM